MRCCKVGCCLHNHGGLFGPDVGSGEHHACSSCLVSFVARRNVFLQVPIMADELAAMDCLHVPLKVALPVLL